MPIPNSFFGGCLITIQSPHTSRFEDTFLFFSSLEFKNRNKSLIFRDKIIFISHLRLSNKTLIFGQSFNVKFQNSMLNFIPEWYEFMPEWYEFVPDGLNSCPMVRKKIAHTVQFHLNKEDPYGWLRPLTAQLVRYVFGGEIIFREDYSNFIIVGLSELQFTCRSGSSGFASPSSFSLSRRDSQSLWYLRLKMSSCWVTPSAPVWVLAFLTLPSRLGWSSSRSHWNLSNRRSYIWWCGVS